MSAIPTAHVPAGAGIRRADLRAPGYRGRPTVSTCPAFALVKVATWRVFVTVTVASISSPVSGPATARPE